MDTYLVTLNSELINECEDFVNILKECLLRHEDKYPNIEKWVSKKVIPEIYSGTKFSNLILKDNKIIGISVVKPGEKTKLCHLYIDENERDNYYGELLVSLMVYNTLRIAKWFHFTLPESLWESKKEFFKSFGFNHIIKTLKPYRKGEDELRCSAQSGAVTMRTADKLKKLLPMFENKLKDIKILL